jgi:hypothetical protein
MCRFIYVIGMTHHSCGYLMAETMWSLLFPFGPVILSAFSLWSIDLEISN